MLELDETQNKALQMMIHSRVGIITGGPGTGKTSVLDTYIQQSGNKKVALVAPTGKAAKRISEVTQHSAMTVHRLLGAKSSKRGWVFEHHSQNMLQHDVVICDEASMLDVETASYLMDAVDTARTQVFFIGDVNQLPSVGPGQVLGDLIDSGRVEVVRLEKVHRAAQRSWVCRNAPLILDGDIDLTTACEDFRFYQVAGLEDLARTVVKLVTEAMPQKGVKDVQVLTPQNGGDIGVEQLNLYLQSALNPMVRGCEEEVVRVRASKGTLYEIRKGDRVIATENDYELAVFNGETGVVSFVDKDDEKVGIDFGDRDVVFDFTKAKTLRLAYAITIHKSQGSEHDWVIVVCHHANTYMWNRQLLYTAVTRAKQGVVIAGTLEGVEAALLDDTVSRRRTLLPKLLHV